MGKPITDFMFDQANSGYYIPSEESSTFREAVIPSVDNVVTTSVESVTSVTSPVDAVSSTAGAPPVDTVSPASVERVAVTAPEDVISTTSVDSVASTSSPADDAEMMSA